MSHLDTNAKVVIRTPDGGYLTGGPTEWGVTQDCLKAVVFDFQGDRVAEKLDLIQKLHGLLLKAVPVDPAQLFELCDGCEQPVVPQAIFFDGNRFLCPDCRGRVHPS